MPGKKSISIPQESLGFALVVTLSLMILITALGFNLFGEALREALDPKLRR